MNTPQFVFNYLTAVFMNTPQFVFNYITAVSTSMNTPQYIFNYLTAVSIYKYTEVLYIFNYLTAVSMNAPLYSVHLQLPYCFIYV